MSAIIGVDPGLGGAFALLKDDELIRVDDMPLTRDRRLSLVGIDHLLSEYLEHGTILRAWIERPLTIPKQSIQSTFETATSYGAILGLLAGFGIEAQEIMPARWKAAMQVTANKMTSRTVAAKLFPDHAEAFKRSKDHGRAEAALIALFGATQSYIRAE